jgi:hypothetical protein
MMVQSSMELGAADKCQFSDATGSMPIDFSLETKGPLSASIDFVQSLTFSLQAHSQ